ncbi:TVG0769512 [Thermoplasma volcanium GSS1]|uniref:TVG0769512 protein n=1 Tax=Thermoplasma volcanium (strain ATCC 51530 / DSM 4299 / JCM 9571 / NBRC 15438 / GSS1) TaxID=273116 RepID=Q97AP4_THEVO|nr:DUF1059 domain-containing protein [Thermoplasma volcanium]BAB59908.1 TVG0769512 [Thermoplasma volcanium GSS1]
MSYVFRCRDYGFDCSYTLEEERKEDIPPMVKMHLRYAHGIYDFTDEVRDKVLSVIKEKK